MNYSKLPNKQIDPTGNSLGWFSIKVVAPVGHLPRWAQKYIEFRRAGIEAATYDIKNYRVRHTCGNHSILSFSHYGCI
jgi:hypothetical protein